MNPYHESEERVQLPSMQEVFYPHPEPTYIRNTDPHLYRRINPQRMPLEHHPQVLAPDIRYQTHAVAALPTTATHLTPPLNTITTSTPASPRPQGLVLSVPMCCDKCETKVRRTLEDMDGVLDVLCDQTTQRVVITGSVNAENALRRVRRVKKRSYFWNTATQPVQVSTKPVAAPPVFVDDASLYPASAYNRAPLSGAFRYLSPPRYYSSPYIDSAYRSGHAYGSPYVGSAYRSGYTYSSPYIDSAYRSGYVESRFDSGTPYLQINNAH